MLKLQLHNVVGVFDFNHFFWLTHHVARAADSRCKSCCKYRRPDCLCSNRYIFWRVGTLGLINRDVAQNQGAHVVTRLLGVYAHFSLVQLVFVVKPLMFLFHRARGTHQRRAHETLSQLLIARQQFRQQFLRHAQRLRQRLFRRFR